MKNTTNHTNRILRTAVAVTLASFVTMMSGNAFGANNQHDGMPQEAREALMSRFGLSEAELDSRVALERVALEQDQILRQDLGSSYAGSWIENKTSVFKVATTDASMVPVIQSNGAVPVVHTYSMSELERTMQMLNRDFSRDLTGAIASWHVDVRANRVVITILPQRTAEAVDAIARTRAPLEMIEIAHTIERPRVLTNIYGGTQFKGSSGNSCSSGFAVNGGFVTAGHCGTSMKMPIPPGMY